MRRLGELDAGVKILFRTLLVIALAALIVAPAMAQQSVLPYSVTGTTSTGQLITAPVSASAPFPVILPATGTPSTVVIGPNTYSASAALAANQIVKGSAGTLYSFDVAADTTLQGAAWWIMIYDATTAPADGAVTPVKCYAMPSGTTSFSATFPGGGVSLLTGIVIGVSTNGCFTKAASTHAFISGDYR